jgi:hypothetical protein
MKAHAMGTPRYLRPFKEWTEDDGDVLWWRCPVNEPPWVGSPLNSDWTIVFTGTGKTIEARYVANLDGWKNYYTHWTPLPSIAIDSLGNPLEDDSQLPGAETCSQCGLKSVPSHIGGKFYACTYCKTVFSKEACFHADRRRRGLPPEQYNCLCCGGYDDTHSFYCDLQQLVKLSPLRNEDAKELGIGCGDSCVTGISKGGQHTNGGCRCFRDLSHSRLVRISQRLVLRLRESQDRERAFEEYGEYLKSVVDGICGDIPK